MSARRSLVPALALVASLLLLSAPAARGQERTEDRVVLRRVAGVVWSHGAGQQKRVGAGAPLHVGGLLTTDAGSLATLELPSGEVTLYPVSAVRRTAQGLALERGTIRAEVRVGDLPLLVADELHAFVRGSATVRRVGRGRHFVGVLTTVETGEVTFDAAGTIAQLVAPSALDVSHDGKTIRLRAAPTNQRAVEVHAAGRIVWLNPGESRVRVSGSDEETAERFGAGERFETALLPDRETVRLVLDDADAERFVRLPLNAGEEVRLVATVVTPGRKRDSQVVIDLLDASGVRLVTSADPAPGQPVELSYTSPQPTDLVARVMVRGRAPGPVDLRITVQLGTALQVPPGYRAVPLDLSGLALAGVKDIAGHLLLATPDGIVNVKGGERPSWLLSLDPGQPSPTSIARRTLEGGGVELAYLTEGSGEVQTVRVFTREGDLMATPGPSLGTLAAGPGFGPVAIEADRLPGAYLVAALDHPTAADPGGVGAVYRVMPGAPPVRLLAGLPPLLDLVVDDERLVLASSGSVKLWNVRLPVTGELGAPRLLTSLPVTVTRATLGLMGRELLLVTPSSQVVYRVQPGATPSDPPVFEEFGKTTWFPQGLGGGDGVAFVALSSQPDGQGMVVHAVGRDEDIQRLLDEAGLPRFDREQNAELFAIGTPGEPPPPAPTGDVTGETPPQLDPPPGAPPPAEPPPPAPPEPPPPPPPDVPPVPPNVSGV